MSRLNYLILVLLAVLNFQTVLAQEIFGEPELLFEREIVYPSAADVVDFDGDGDMDVLLAHRDGVRLLENLGDLNFQPQDLIETTFLTFDKRVQEIRAADMDGDGILEIWTHQYKQVNLYQKSIDYELVNTFDYAVSLSIAAPMNYDIVVEDLNADGDLDFGLFIGSTELVFTNTGDLTDFYIDAYNAFGITSPSNIVFFDYNGDGVRDILRLHRSNLGCMFGAEDGTFSEQVDLTYDLETSSTTPAYYNMQVGNLDADPEFEMVSLNQMYDGTLEVLVYDRMVDEWSADHFTLPDSQVWKGEITFDIRDVDRDGLNDIVSSAASGEKLLYLKNMGGLVFKEAIRATGLPLGGAQFITANFDDDESLESLVLDELLNAVNVFDQVDGAVDVKTIYDAFPNRLSEFSLEDIDNDSNIDFCAEAFVVLREHLKICFKNNGGNGLVSEDPYLSYVSENAYDQVLDFNDDGFDDRLKFDNGAITYEAGNSDGTFLEADTLLQISFQATAFEVGDFNMDGNQDLVYIDLEVLKVVYLDGQAQVLDVQEFSVNALSGESLFRLDLNDDGLEDMLFASRSFDEITLSVLINDLDNGFTLDGQMLFPRGTTEFHLVDYDSDGDQDLFLEDFFASDELFVLENVHGYSFELRSVAGYNSTSAISGLKFHDFNADGFLDLTAFGSFDVFNYTFNPLLKQYFLIPLFDGIDDFNLCEDNAMESWDFNSDQFNDLIFTSCENSLSKLYTSQAISNPPQADFSLILENCSEYFFFPNWGYTYEGVNVLWDFGDGNTSTNIFVDHPYSELGEYQVSLTLCNDQEYDEFTQSVNVEKTISLEIPETAGVNEAITFSNSSQGWTNFSWIFGDGEVSIAQSPVHQYSEEGVYEIELFLTDNTQVGCTYTRKQLISIGQFSSIEEQEESPFFIFPNPSSDYLYTSGRGLQEVLDYEIRSSDGSLLLSGKIESQESAVDVSALAPGMYFFVLSSGETQKFVVH